MGTKIPNVDHFLSDGCGRCERYQTSTCKVHSWQKELMALRAIVADTELEETIKWGQPCYTLNGKNVLVISCLNDAAVLGFFKGALLSDRKKVLVAPGKNSRFARQFRFESLGEIEDLASTIATYVDEAIRLEREGKEVENLAKNETIIPELAAVFEKDEPFENAFNALTPGRQRGYLIHFEQAKQPKTRFARIEKWREAILKGEGMHDAYRKSKK
jgi:uncharacterized protein YdeI (YjbR/CyaY-like superfamily)